jgi:hypothetical protein
MDQLAVEAVLPVDSDDPPLDPNYYWTAQNFDLTHPVNTQPLFLP